MKSIELFAGAGGLGIGLHQAGFKPFQIIEWDRYCCDTIRANKEQVASTVAKWPLIEGDVKALDFRRFSGRTDLVSGGPPCQPFSLGGKHMAYEDNRDMFPEAIRTVRETQPRAFIFENVKGLTRAKFRNYFEYIKLQLEHPLIRPLKDEDWMDHLKRLERHHTSGIRNDLHYNVITRVVNAANYGIPQKRERVFFVGFRDNLGIEWSFPEETHSFDALLWDQVNEGSYWERHGVARNNAVINTRIRQCAEKLTEKPSKLPWQTVRDAISGLPNPEFAADQNSLFPDHRYQPGARAYPGHTGSPLDEPAKTLKAGVHGVPGGENMVVLPDGRVRYFTIRESARLQTFPDNFRFYGSWTESMRQLGNAVPVELARIIGTDVASHLKPKKKKNS